MKTKTKSILRRNSHLAALVALHASPLQANGKKMFHQLRKIEMEANRAACAQCNGEAFEGQPFRPNWLPNGEEGTEANPTQWEIYAETVYKRVYKVFGGKTPAGFFYNQDPLGYSLKLINPPSGIDRDFGDYGILAPKL
jgi:hypothetical protein